MFFSLLLTILFIFFISCDEDYVNSLSSISPKISMEVVSDLNENYLGEFVEDIEILIKVKDSPSISSLAFSVEFQPDFFVSDSIIMSSSSDNLFFNVAPNAQINKFLAFTDSTFEVNMGFTNNQDTTYTFGDGNIVSLFLQGRNVETDFNLVLDNVLSYDSNINIENWTAESVSFGKPTPQVFGSNFNIDIENNILSFDINTLDLPELTDSQLKISYDKNIFSYISENSPELGVLLNQGFDVVFDNSVDGEVLFSFEQSDGNDDKFISGGGTLVKVKFNLISDNVENEELNFQIDFIDSIYDTCGECNNPSYEERFDFDVSFWGSYDFLGFLFGCKNEQAINFQENILINNDGLCLYE